MKKILFTTLLLCSTLANAYHIQCYSGKHLIYNGYGHDFIYGDRAIYFAENKTNRSMFIEADCIVKVK